jgi:hypothetical protein
MATRRSVHRDAQRLLVGLNNFLQIFDQYCQNAFDLLERVWPADGRGVGSEHARCRDPDE